MPISSLPSPYGIGTFGKAAYDFADFLHAAGQGNWQLLPLGPTSYGDSPYQSFSTFAGNPYFIDLDLLIKDKLLTRKEVTSCAWGAEPRYVDYGKIYESRFALLEKAKVRGWARDREAVAAFESENSRWLPDYALFMALKRHFGMKSWTEWPDEGARLHKTAALERYRAELRGDVELFTYIQFLFFRQWSALKSYINGLGIRIIGDIPIYVAMDSSDVWSEPEKFQLDDIKPSSRKYPYIDFRPNREIGNDVLQVEGLTKTVDGVKILDNLSFTLGREDKVAFVGSNEQAITMLFKILTGEEEPDSGYYKRGVTTTQAYFPKDNTAEFDCDLTIADWLTQYSEIKDVTYVRGFLGRMLFAGEDGVKRVRVLSGGEKVRCLLSKMMISGANVLVLDEPTNHLDMESITALNNGLIKFPGVLLFTCHDHQFVQTTANRIMEILPNGALIDKMTTYDEYLASDEMARKRHVYTMTEEDN